MFKCDKCGKITKPREKQTKKVVEKRDKIYTNGDKESTGKEIVKEINLCEECAKEESNEI